MAITEVQIWDAERGEGRTLTRDEYIAEFGQQKWDETYGFDWPVLDPADMTDAERTLHNRMQAEHAVNDAAARAGISSVFDLPSEDDGESIPLDDLVPQEYDDAGAAADLKARSDARKG